MVLDTKRQKEILVDILEDKKEENYSSEESRFRKELEKDVELAKKNNWVIEIPGEWEVE